MKRGSAWLCCTGLGEAAGALPAICAGYAALPHRQQDGGGGHVAAPGNLYGLESGHSPLRQPHHGTCPVKVQMP